MFQDEVLKNHLETSSTIKSQSAIIAEWNMNLAENIFAVGNYRYRPYDPSIPKYQTLVNTFDEYDEGYFYTAATDADAVVDGGLDDQDIPTLFRAKKEKENILYSLEECFNRFRPRSGINKTRFLETSSQYIHHSNPEMARRPRYYMADKEDKFKYWTSYRTEAIYKYFEQGTTRFGANPKFIDSNEEEQEGQVFSVFERGIANQKIGLGNTYYIEDTAPFIVYKDSVPSNRIIIKMQTSVGDVDLGPFEALSGETPDPFFGYKNQSTPSNWKIQYLENDSWVDAISFDENSTRRNGEPVIGSDGYVEVSYGLIIPELYREIFRKAEELSSVGLLPDSSVNGYSYLVRSSSSDLGVYYVWMSDIGEYESFVPSYGWYLTEPGAEKNSSYVSSLVDPPSFINPSDGKTVFREFQDVLGLRIVVQAMNKFDSVFDLIELSPRLSIDLAERTSNFSIQKIASDLGISGLPVSQLLASIGSITIFDYDQAFNRNNKKSIISKYVSQNIQIKFYEIITGVEDSGNTYDYYVPIKTMYSEGFPETDEATRSTMIALRDMLFYFESIAAPEILITNASVSFVVSMLLDHIGFSNYTFLRVAGESEPIIPYFFVAPDKSVAEILNDIAISTQTAMFFDEYNNFVMMSKDYMMPTTEQRATDLVLRGSSDSYDNGILENKQGRVVDGVNQDQKELANIIDVSSQENEVYNDGVINYNERFIQKTYGKIKLQNQTDDRAKTWIYKPVELWEISGSEEMKSINGEVSSQASYTLSAVPLNSDLSEKPPTVENFRVVNNTIDLGEGVYSLSRYNGYFYSNGEVIRYDAVQFNIPGFLEGNEEDIEGNNVWIRNNQQYQNYFSKVPFNGKIYPTGLVRVYSEPIYEEVQGVTRLRNGPVGRHGRGQFGTDIVSHSAGLDSHWSEDRNVRGCEMKSQYLFKDFFDTEIIQTSTTRDTILIVRNSGTTLFVNPEDISKISVGQRVKVPYDTVSQEALLVAETVVTSVNSSELSGDGLNSFTVNALEFSYSFDRENVSLITDLDPVKKTEKEKDLFVRPGVAGANYALATQTTRNGIIRNFLSSTPKTEKEANQLYATQVGTVQASALIMNGPPFSTDYNPLDFVSYVNKPLGKSFRHFGTRMRIVGKLENQENRDQTPFGSFSFYNTAANRPDTNSNIVGASGGLGVLVDPTTNNGYYFEIIAFSEQGESEGQDIQVDNVIFYKILKDSDSNFAIPVKLWGGSAAIGVDSGDFVGQYRISGEEFPTVYDLSVEYEDFGGSRRFYLYINNQLLSVVDDDQPLEIYNNMALFIRGSSRCMFENIYALEINAGRDSGILDAPVKSIFGDSELDVSQSFNKYALSGIINSSHLSGISSFDSPKYSIYFDEFGSIMREAAYFNIKYDKAYPALYAKIAPTFNKLKGYAISGFLPGAYGAEFLVFNATDTILSLDSESGNFLRIQGVAFNQESSNELSVDDYFSQKADFSNPEFVENSRVISPTVAKLKYLEIKSSRATHGRNEFSLTTEYIQTRDAAEALMSWMIGKIMVPRRSIGLKIFSTPILQLGDIVEINYKDRAGISILGDENSRYVVYDIEYSKTFSGPEMNVYLSEVV
jgi:hypothetical protein